MTSSPIMLKENTTQVSLAPTLSANVTEFVSEAVVGKEDAGPACHKSQNDTKDLSNDDTTTEKKIEKPRPHVCGTCQRSFARLEHLKRHERSHTKEKPFECPECARRFARRDLLLRHQQKLHMSTTPAARPRNRRESTASTAAANAGPGRVRKNSLANGQGVTSGRPRANTISHIEGASFQLMTAANSVPTMRPGNSRTHNRHSSLVGLPFEYEYHSQLGGIPNTMGQRTSNNCLPRLETRNFTGANYGGGLRTAPLMGGFNYQIDSEGYMLAPNSTINPNALHYTNAPYPIMYDTSSPFQQNLASRNICNPHCDENLEWVNGFDHSCKLEE